METRNRRNNGRGRGSGRPMLVDNSTWIPLEAHVDDRNEAPERSQNQGHHNGATQSGPNSQDQGGGSLYAPQRSTRIAWSHDEYKEIIWCYEYGKMIGNTSMIGVYEIWRSRNQNSRPNLNANSLATQRRYIINNNKVSETELEEIQRNVEAVIRQEANDISGNDGNETEDEEYASAEDSLSISEQDYASAEESSTSIDSTDDQISLKEDILLKLYEVQIVPWNKRSRLQKIQENRAANLIKQANRDLEKIILEQQPDLDQINQLLYATACIVTEKMTTEKTTKRINNNEQASKRIVKQIEVMRKDLSVLVEYKRQNIKKKHFKVKSLLKKYSIKNEDDLVLNIEKLKQRITVKVQRKKRIEKCIAQFRQNKLFQENQKQMYRNLRNQSNSIDTSEQPTINEVEEFWSRIFEDNVEHNKNAEWQRNLQMNENDKMMWNRITIDEIRNVSKKFLNWKSPGLDQVTNFWLKKLTAVHHALAEEFNKLVEKIVQPPEWFTQGLTNLIPKVQKPKQPKDYRPITCLPTMYKLFTAVIAQRLNSYIVQNNVMPVEQKGCCRNSAGCKDQLLISKMILQDCKIRKQNLSVAWIDYQKAFDSIPHSWLLKSLELAGAADEIVEVCRTLMATWKTTCVLRDGKNLVHTRKLHIKRGIFQGDSLSPLMFCIALAPLSKLINKLGYGYKLKGSEVNVSHLVYMDDLKLFATSHSQLQLQLETVKEFSKDIKMSFGVEKCATLSIRSGKVTEGPDIMVEEDVIKQLDTSSYYKYLGIEEAANLDHVGMKKKLTTEYYTRVRSILRSQLNAKNKFIAIGTLAMPVLQYSFPIINWTITEIRILDRKTRKLLMKYDANHPYASVDRIYVPRFKGGRGLLQVERSYKCAIINTANYLHQRSNADKIVDVIKLHDMQSRPLRSIQKRAVEYLSELQINKDQLFQDNLKTAKEKVKNAYFLSAENGWKAKEMYGQYVRDLEKSQAINKEKSFMWLRSAGLKVETESLLIAAQDQAIRTNYRDKMIFKMNVNPLCRICKQSNETVTHILSSCPTLALKEYIERHDKVAKLLHFNICKAYNINVGKNWYEHVPKQVMTNRNGKVTIYWNSPVHTDRTVSANKPDILIKDTQSERICILIDVAVPADNNVIKKEAEKTLKYSDLRIEIQRMWNVKTKIIPIVIGATGVVSVKIEDNLKMIPGIHRLQEVQKTAVLGSAHLLRKTLM